MPDEQFLPRSSAFGWFVYGLQVVLGATLNVQGTGTVRIYQNADFELWSVQSTSTGNFSIVFGTSTVLFMGGSSDSSNTDAVPFIRNTNILGTGQLPHILPGKIIFPRGSLIRVQLRNDTALSNTVDLAFEGLLKENSSYS
jgi:hypothetical protein